jgi:hypothetical protein
MSMRRILFTSLLAAPGLILGQAAPHPSDAPLPNPGDLLQRAIANEAKLAREQERYECRVNDETTELDSKGNVKKKDTENHEQFYVNGVEVERTLSKNGKDLTPDENRKEDERVMKKTVKYSDEATAKKETDKQNKQMQEILSAMMLTSAHRQQVDGRSVLL